jgi:C4-dicarboxylate-binding protein DctP
MPRNKLFMPGASLTMPRRRLLGGAAAATALGATASLPFGRARAQADYTMTIAHSEAIGSPMTQAFDHWADLIVEQSEGLIEVEHFPAGQMGNYTQLIEMSRLGTVQATAGGPDTEEAVAPEIAIAGGAPGFIYADQDHVDRVLQGELGDEISRIARERTGVEFVAYGEVGFRHLLSSRPVTNLEELGGLKLRVPELEVWIDFWSLLGANPTPLAYAEQYSALSTGVIDGLEADVFSILGFRWFEQAQHFTHTYHWFLPKAVRVNAAWLDSLPDELQAIVRGTAAEAFAEQRETNRANTQATLEELQGLGMEVHELADMEEWVSRAEQLWDQYAERGPAVADMMERILALR